MSDQQGEITVSEATCEQVNIVELKLDDIVRDQRTQARETILQPIVEDYADDMRNGDKFPPCVVFHDGDVNWLADGTHRVLAAILAGLKTIECEVHQGGLEDAILFALGANATHGVRRSAADKRRAVRRVLMQATWASWSDRRIAKLLSVSNKFVSAMRNESTNPDAHRPVRMMKRNGVEIPMRLPERRNGDHDDVPKPIATAAPERKTANSEFFEFTRRLRHAGHDPKTHAKGKLDIPCVTTLKPRRLHVVFSHLSPEQFKVAFADALIARQTIDPKSKPFVVGRRSEDIAELIAVAAECGVGFIEIGS